MSALQVIAFMGILGCVAGVMICVFCERRPK